MEDSFSIVPFPRSFAARKLSGLEFWMRPAGRDVSSVVNLFLAGPQTERGLSFLSSFAH